MPMPMPDGSTKYLSSSTMDPQELKKLGEYAAVSGGSSGQNLTIERGIWSVAGEDDSDDADEHTM